MIKVPFLKFETNYLTSNLFVFIYFLGMMFFKVYKLILKKTENGNFNTPWFDIFTFITLINLLLYL